MRAEQQIDHSDMKSRFAWKYVDKLAILQMLKETYGRCEMSGQTGRDLLLEYERLFNSAPDVFKRLSKEKQGGREDEARLDE